MTIKQTLTPDNTTAFNVNKLAALEHGTSLEQSLFQAQQTGAFDPFYAALKTHLDINSVADTVKEFVESTVLIDSIKGYVNLNGITHYLKDFFTYEKLFHADFPGLFPALYLNSDMWLMVETGHVLVLNHDGTFNEVATDVLAGADTRENFNKAFTDAGSYINITQLIQLQTAWFELGIVNNWGADDEVQEEAALRAVQRLLDCSVDALETIVNKQGMEFVYQLCYMFIEDYDGFSQMKII